MDNVYEKLAAYLDSLPAGFPRTENGLELRILRKLFTPAEAAVALHLTLLSEEARVVAFRARQPAEAVGQTLEEMARKGLISSSHRPGESARYAISQFVVGFYEGQVNRLDREFAELAEEYAPHFFRSGLWNKAPQMRTIPVGESIPITSEVMPYLRAEEIVRKNSLIAVQPCVCRQEQKLLEGHCAKPMETCLSFGGTAEGVAYSGNGRLISQEEALALLKRADDAGLVLQPANSQDPIFLCACCGCCCGVLRFLKTQERPVDLVSNPFTVQLDAEVCAGCGVCADRCQMDAISLATGAAEHNPDRCIGCGLCVSTCPTGALALVKRPDGKPVDIPRNTIDTYLRLGQVRDRLNLARMASMVVKSGIDRLIAPRK